jgi:mannosyltransferase
VTSSDISTEELAARPSGPSLRTGRKDRWAVGAMVALAVLLRAPNLGRAYWVDEAISIGIASHPLSQLPHLLRQDGSPPLFYVILHFWVRLFGTSEPATHMLPLLISLIAVPVAYWSGTDLFDRRAGLAAAALMATNPFLNWYSTETRMYTLVVVLAMVALTFAWKAMRDRRPADAAAAVVAFTSLLYTHDWCIYLVAVTGLVMLWLAWSRRDHVLILWVVGCGVAAVTLWLPWLPVFLFQAGNTAAPWAVQPGIGDFFADPASALGGTLGFFVAPLLALGAYWCRGRVGADALRISKVLAGIALLSTIMGFLGAEIEPSWTVRYLAIVIAPYLLAAAGILGASRRGRAVVWTGCAALTAWGLVGMLLPNPNSRYAKDNMADLAASVGRSLQPGDAVVITQTEQVPVAYHYLPPGLQYLNPTGPVPDPSVVDWRNIVHRLQQATPCEALSPTLDAMPVGADVLEIDPVRQLGANGSSWSRAVNSQVVAVDEFLAHDPALTALQPYSPGLQPRPFSPVAGVLFEKTSAKPACS